MKQEKLEYLQKRPLLLMMQTTFGYTEDLEVNYIFAPFLRAKAKNTVLMIGLWQQNILMIRSQTER